MCALASFLLSLSCLHLIISLFFIFIFLSWLPDWYQLVQYCTLSMTECRVGTPYMRRNFIDGPPKASVDQSGPSFLQKLHLGYVPGPQKNFGDHSTFFSPKIGRFWRAPSLRWKCGQSVENVGRAAFIMILPFAPSSVQKLSCPHFQRSAHIFNEGLSDTLNLLNGL